VPGLRRHRPPNTKVRPLTVRIPPGVDDGQRIRVAGKGEPGGNGGPNGDLFVRVHVSPHPVFGRSGNDLTLIVPVTFPELAMGTTLTVPTLDKDHKVSLKVQPGTRAAASIGSVAEASPSGTAGPVICWSPSRSRCRRNWPTRPRPHWPSTPRLPRTRTRAPN